MNRRKPLLILAVVLLALGLWWLLRALVPDGGSQTEIERGASSPEEPKTPRTSSAEDEDKKQVIEQITGVFSAPIAFYGRVIDQNGDPVPHANVGYTAADKFNASGSNYTGQADEKGFFEISGIQGAGLAVAVRKDGYYFVDETPDRSVLSSAATFAFGMGPDSYRRPPPTKDNPAIFVLHKMGKTEPLVHGGKRRYKPSKDGQPLDVNLESGNVVPAGQGDIRFERWAKVQARNQRGHFDWRLRIIVPGGGLAERKGQFDFEAPVDGFKESVEVNMPASLGDQWSYTVNMSYFVRLRDGRYARFDAMVQAGHESSALVVDAFLNPKPGSRNLEYDPNQAGVTR